MGTGWYFPRLSGGEEQGLNEPGIEVFKKAKSLGRETCQNIGDARPPSATEPAIATFDLVDLPITDFPDVQGFRKHFDSCRGHVLDQLPDGTGNESRFFERGDELLDGATIRTLRIGDENTTGLVGADGERGSPFWRLIKGQGMSSLQGVGGGTYGIGQRAPFAHSALRTVLYSTRTESGSAFVAKSILASHPRPSDGHMSQSKGWWCVLPDEAEGKFDWKPARQTGLIPKRFQRDQVGTDLWVTGFLTEDWETSIRHSVLQHFFAAIHNGQLVVQLAKDGAVQRRIDASNLEMELLQAADEARERETADEYRKGLLSTVYFHRALTLQTGGVHSPAKPIPKAPGLKLYVHRDTSDPDVPERWATMRRPRILVESHGSGLLTKFAAVLLCDSIEGNRYLAQMEDPAHERWHEEEARNWTGAEKRAGRETLRAIRRFVRDTLKKIRGENMPDQQDIPFLGRYLPAEDEPEAEDAVGAASEPSGTSTDEESGLKRSKDRSREPIEGNASRSSRSRAQTTDTAKGGDAGGPGPGTGGGGGGNDAGTGGPGGGSGGDGEGDDDPPRRVIRPRDVRFRSFVAGAAYKVVIAADAAVAGDLYLRAVGEDGSYSLELTTVTDESGVPLKFKGGTIFDVSIEAGSPTTLLVHPKSDIKLCLAVAG